MGAESQKDWMLIPGLDRGKGDRTEDEIARPGL